MWVLSASMENRIAESTHFSAAGNVETGEEATGWDLAAGRGRERSEGGG